MKKYMLQLWTKDGRVLESLYSDLEEAQKQEHYMKMFDDYDSVELYEVEVNVIARI